MELPSGARFFACSLQVNPFAYLARHAKQTSYQDEAAYNTAMVAACVANGIEVVGLTDHYRIDTSRTLAEGLRDAGVTVLPGFEAVSKTVSISFACSILRLRRTRSSGASESAESSRVAPTHRSASWTPLSCCSVASAGGQLVLPLT